MRTLGEDAGGRPMPRADLAMAVALAVATAASRIPGRARLLPTWDAVQFALAVERYDIAAHQPHPPGYILYVAAARALELVTRDATQSLVWLSIAASGVAVFLVYRLGFMLYGRRAAALAAAGFAASPLFWFYGEVGLPYAVEAALASLVAALTWAASSRRRAIAGSAVALGLAAGVRQSLLPILFPLWAWMSWTRARRAGPLLVGLGAMAVAVALWLLPMLGLAGGLDAYLAVSHELFESTVRPTSVLAPSNAWLVNVIALGEAAVLGLGLLLPVTVWAAVRAARRGWSPRASFLALWILPALAVYVFLHFGQYGYLLAVLPAVYLPLGAALAELLEGSRRARAVAGAALAGVLAAHVGFAVLAPSIRVPEIAGGASWATREAVGLEARYRYRLWPHTLRGLRESEAVIDAYVTAIRRSFSPDDTVIVVELGNPRSYPWFRHLTYYVPEFRVCHLRLPPWSAGYLDSTDLATMAAHEDVRIPLAPGVRHLVWVVDSWDPKLPRPAGLRELSVPYGRKLYALDLRGGAVAHAGYVFEADGRAPARAATAPPRARAFPRPGEGTGAAAQAGTERRGER